MALDERSLNRLAEGRRMYAGLVMVYERFAADLADAVAAQAARWHVTEFHTAVAKERGTAATSPSCATTRST